MQVGFPSLRELVAVRPPVRQEAMKMLLELTTHPGEFLQTTNIIYSESIPERLPRTAAINTIRRWIPDVQPMDQMTRHFALQMLRRLQTRTAADGAAEEEDGQLPQEALLQTEYLSPELQLPAEKLEVQQHTELLFALCVKVPELLDE
jgi:symplekin